MDCNERPTDFDKQQLAKCKVCHWASKSVRFCGRPEWGGIDIGYPSKTEMAKSFGKAVVKQVRAGNPKRSPEKISEMMRICKQCPSYVADAERCRKCGCRMPAKIKWATQKCPKEKW